MAKSERRAKLFGAEFPLPTERHWITIGIFMLIFVMLMMAREDPELWDNETFKDVFRTITFTGLLNMILAFHFSSSAGDEKKTENTGKLADAFKSVATGGLDPASKPDYQLEPGETAQAVKDE